MAVTWNPWHGCRKISPGCANCYVYRIDRQHDRDPQAVFRTGLFDLPRKRRRDGGFRIPSGETVFTCLSSDFFLPEADSWRPVAWAVIRSRPDLAFFIITKRIERFFQGLPPDWGDGYANVTIAVTVEDQMRAALRLPILAELPLRRTAVMCEPLLEAIDLTLYFAVPRPDKVIVGGESGPEARPCRYDWVLDLHRQCRAAGVAFQFRQTGAVFVKDGRTYRIRRALQSSQAARAGLDLNP